MSFVPFRLTVCGLDELGGHCEAQVTHVLSILDPGWPVPLEFGQYGEHAVAKKAGVLKDDIVVAFDGQKQRMTETELLAYALQQKRPGDEVPVTVWRNGERLDVKIRLQ